MIFLGIQIVLSKDLVVFIELTELVCHLWNLVAHETREGSVFDRLFEKLEEARSFRR